jgi:putative lipoic acid-binding regulatory protein
MHQPNSELPVPLPIQSLRHSVKRRTSSAAVLGAVCAVVPVGRDAMRIRPSSAGRYQCVTVLVRLENSTQLASIYANLRRVANLSYLL